MVAWIINSLFGCVKLRETIGETLTLLGHERRDVLD
jgi:hypothetical protein